jgi:hypothetical protein
MRVGIWWRRRREAWRGGNLLGLIWLPKACYAMIACISAPVIALHISCGLHSFVVLVVNEHIPPMCSAVRYFETDCVLSSPVFKKCHTGDPVTPSSGRIRGMGHWKFVNEPLNILRNRLVARDRRNLRAHFSVLTTHLPNRFPTFYRIRMTRKCLVYRMEDKQHAMLAASQKNRHCQQSAEC